MCSVLCEYFLCLVAELVSFLFAGEMGFSANASGEAEVLAFSAGVSRWARNWERGWCWRQRLWWLPAARRLSRSRPGPTLRALGLEVSVRQRRRCRIPSPIFAGWRRRFCRCCLGRCRTGIFAWRRWCWSPICRWDCLGSSRCGPGRTEFRRCVREWELFGWVRVWRRDASWWISFWRMQWWRKLLAAAPAR